MVKIGLALRLFFKSRLTFYHNSSLEGTHHHHFYAHVQNLLRQPVMRKGFIDVFPPSVLTQEDEG